MLLFVLFLYGGTSLHAQGYQAAKQVLVGQAVNNILLKERPSSSSRIVTKVNSGQKLLITGRDGEWMEVEFLEHKGWSLQSDIEVLGIYTESKAERRKAKKKEKKEKKPQSSPSEKVRREKSQMPWFVGPSMYYAGSGKSFYKHLRAGMELCYFFDLHNCVGLLAEGIFKNGSMYVVGPTIKHQIRSKNSSIAPNVGAALLYYQFDRSSDQEKSLGTQIFVGASRSVAQIRDIELHIQAKIAADLIFVGVEEVRIPFGVGMSLAMRF
ncbi:MAG: SH3 domain-containing protein [Bdellovibrionales bacterium]|nr:SH3 domain-containing protein [Bdellovibrionales bacterium]